MREAHFGAVYDAIPYAFYQCKDVMVLGVEDDLLQRRLFQVSTCGSYLVGCARSYLERVQLVHVSFSETGFNRASVQANDAQSQLLGLASSLRAAAPSQKERNRKDRWKSKAWYIGSSRKVPWSETAGYGAAWFGLGSLRHIIGESFPTLVAAPAPD